MDISSFGDGEPLLIKDVPPIISDPNAANNIRNSGKLSGAAV
jgi:hypothetical protein